MAGLMRCSPYEARTGQSADLSLVRRTIKELQMISNVTNRHESNAMQVDKGTASKPKRIDAIVVGAGFAGLYMLYRLRELGISARVIEAAPNVGGTWYWNRYPGARCDIDSMQYSFQFSEEVQQEWTWTERYAAQPEILAYIQYVAKKFDLNREIEFNTRVEKAAFDETTDRWQIETSASDIYDARFFVLAVGPLSTPLKPNFDGHEDFKGSVYFTSSWPEKTVDFSGQKVGVIGTGSSGVQTIPKLADEAEELFVFQRTPNYVVPAQNRPLSSNEVAEIKADYPEFRRMAKQTPLAFTYPNHTDSALDCTDAERQERFEEQWKVGGLPFAAAFGDLTTNMEANRYLVEFWQSKLREIVKDPEMAEILTPKEVYGCRRVCSSTGYYETFNRDSVTLVDVSGTGVEKFTENGLIANGQEYDLDAIVCATGFDAITGSVTRIQITGLNGLTIGDAWSEGAKSYLGISVAGFPNMFNINGPGSPGVLATMVTGAEYHVDWICDCITWMQTNRLSRIDAEPEAQENWVEKVNEIGNKSIRSQCDSWYVGANVPGKPRVFMPYAGGFPNYVNECDQVSKRNYEGFSMQ